MGGIQLDPELNDSRRMFDVIFRMLGDGDSAVPAGGMQRIPEQLAERLPAGCIHYERPVAEVHPGRVHLADGESVQAAAVVVAAEGPVAAELTGVDPVESKSVGCVYFATDESPTGTRYVVLDGTGRGPVLNVAVMSNVAPSYAPAGKHLIVASLPGHIAASMEIDARRQLRDWWGAKVDGWAQVASYRIEHGQPTQRPPFPPKRPVELPSGVFVCGDHRDTASIQGAMYSGRRGAEAVAARLGGDLLVDAAERADV